MIPLFIFLLTFSQKQIAENPIIIDAAGSRYASEYVLVTTPVGIYTFDRNAKTWKSITTAHGLPDNHARIVGLDQGIMWVATDQGLASADVRLNDWQTYALPGPVTGMTFDESYVWVTGSFGLKRFDKYVEVWEDINDAPANDILLDKTYLWLATPSGVWRYNMEFERLEEMYAAPKYDYYYIIETRSKLWFLARDKFVVYERTTASWSEYTALEISDYSILGDSLFITSSNKVFLYNPATNSWGPFVEVEILGNVNGISTSPKVSNFLSFATDQGLLLYDPLNKTRTVYNRANGLLNDTIVDVYEASEFIFAVGRGNIQYLDKNTGIWQSEDMARGPGPGGRILYYDEAGLHASFWEDLDMRLEGRSFYSLSTTVTDSATWSDYSTINLRLIGQHESDRIISLYYDDTNKEDTLYGFGYRGLESDFLHRASGGLIESEYYEFDLIPQFSTFGANARLRQNAHGLMLQGGQLKSKFKSDFFYGRSFDEHDTIPDIRYSKYTFYRTASAGSIHPSGSDTIFIDDLDPATNSVATRTNHTLAGITGDFDPLINGLDYFIDYQAGFFQLLSAASDSTTIILKSNGQETVIQSYSVRDNMLENIYVLGPDIVPGSLEMLIRDTLGTVYPLSDFGIDADNNGRVDPEHLNNKLGYLIFPQARPFPDEVYENGINIYTIEYKFLTHSVFYRLSEQPVLINSEKVYVDGEQMVREFHYIVDYTSGTVLFLSEEVVNDFSEIEIQYVALARERDDIFYSVQPNMKIGSDINLAPGYTAIEDENILHLSGKYQAGNEDRSVMYVPQLAANSDREYAQDHRLIANYHILTVNANYRGYSQGFESFGLSDRRYGKLRHSGTVSLGLEPLNYVRLNATLKQEAMLDSLNIENRPQYISGRVDYLNPRLPNGFLLIARNDLPDHEKLRMQVNANYNFRIAGNAVRLSSVGRQDILTYETDKKRTAEYILSTNIALSIPIGTDIYVHGADLYDNDDRERKETEMRLALNIDAVPGLYYTGNYRQKSSTYYLPGSKDVSINHYLYNNLNIAPGRWYAPLSIINFSIGNGRNFDEYVDNVPQNQDLPSFTLEPLEHDIATLTDLRTVYAKVYLTPISNLNIQFKHATNRSGIGRYGMPILRPNHSDEIRAEYEQSAIGFLAAVYTRSENQVFPVQITRNLYMEWTKPWTAALRTKLSGNVRTDIDDYTTALTEDSETNVRFETLLRFGKRSYFNASLAGRRQDRYLNGIINTILPGCSIYLNFFEFLFMQFDYQANVVIDASTTHLLSAKIAGSF